MPVDLQFLKVVIFDGINDIPREPSDGEEGNGSHIISLFNSLVDEVESNINSLASNSFTGFVLFNSLLLSPEFNKVYEFESEQVAISLNLDAFPTPPLPIPFPDNIGTNLLSFWKFDEASNPADPTLAIYNKKDSYGSNDLAVTGQGITTVEGKVGSAVNFNQLSDNSFLKVAATNPNLEMLDTNDLSISLWVNPSAVNRNQVLLRADGSYYVVLRDNGTFAFYIPDFEEVDRGVFCTTVFAQPDNWYHVRCTYNTTENQVKIKVNNSVITSGACQAAAIPRSNIFYLGTYSGETDFYEGKIDSVGIWNRLLSIDEEAYLYNNGFGAELPVIVSANKIQNNPVPFTSISPGDKGQVVFDSDYVYVCTATDEWKRTPLTTW